MKTYPERNDDRQALQSIYINHTDMFSAQSKAVQCFVSLLIYTQWGDQILWVLFFAKMNMYLF